MQDSTKPVITTRYKSALITLYISSICFAFAILCYYRWLLPKLPDTMLRWSVLTGIVLMFMYKWIPGLIAYRFAKRENIELPVFKYINRTLGYAVSCGIIVILATLLISMAFDQFSFAYYLSLIPRLFLITSYPVVNATAYLVFIFICGILSSFTINLLYCLGEEIFFRGYLHTRFSAFSFYKQAFIIGFLWGCWHIPLIIIMGLNTAHYISTILIGSATAVSLSLLLSPILLHLRERGKNLLTTTVFHGFLVAMGNVPFYFFVNGNPLLIGLNGLAGVTALAIFNVYIFTERRKAAVQPSI